MPIIEKTKFLHWNYFLAIESDVEELSRFVEFAEHNFKTYSIEIAHVLFAASSEIDVVAKLLCSKVKPKKKAKNIADYRKLLCESYPIISKMKILIPRYGLNLTPWKNWKSDKNPNWWTAYNNVKHERDKYYQDANLKNALNAMASLYVLLLFLYRKPRGNVVLEPSPALFRVDNGFFYGIEMNDSSLTLRSNF